jgi:hypothetical protein
MKVNNPTTISTPLRRRRRNCRSESNSRIVDIEEDLTTSSSSFTLAISNANYVGKRKRSRATIHDDFRLRNNSIHDYDMSCADDANL